jgi:hypothetical protein
MENQYAVWTGEFDNDRANWYTDHGTAFTAWRTLAETLADGESAYMQRFDGEGDPDEDFPHELRSEGGDIREYYNGARLWVACCDNSNPLGELLGDCPELTWLDEAWVACYRALGGDGDPEFRAISDIIEARRRRIIESRKCSDLA